MHRFLTRLIGSRWGMRAAIFSPALIALVLTDILWDAIANYGASHWRSDWLIEHVLIAPGWAIAALAFFAVLAAGLLWRNLVLEAERGPALAIAPIRLRGETLSEIKLRLHNRGRAALSSCWVQVEELSDGHDTNGLPRRLRTEQQARDNESGPFALAAGESVNLPFCRRRVCDPATATDPMVLAYDKAGPFAALPAISVFVTLSIHVGRGPLLKRYRLYVDRDHQLDLAGPF